MRKDLRIARRLAGLTQETMALKIGISRTHYNAIEQGRRNPSLPVAMKIAEILGVEMGEIFLPANVTEGNEISAELRPEG